jgi:hypothetical protein
MYIYNARRFGLLIDPSAIIKALCAFVIHHLHPNLNDHRIIIRITINIR